MTQFHTHIHRFSTEAYSFSHTSELSCWRERNRRKKSRTIGRANHTTPASRPSQRRALRATIWSWKTRGLKPFAYNQWLNVETDRKRLLIFPHQEKKINKCMILILFSYIWQLNVKIVCDNQRILPQTHTYIHTYVIMQHVITVVKCLHQSWSVFIVTRNKIVMCLHHVHIKFLYM